MLYSFPTRRSSDLIARAVEAAISIVEAEGDLHATADYRRRVAGVMLERAIREARAQALGTKVQCYVSPSDPTHRQQQDIRTHRQPTDDAARFPAPRGRPARPHFRPTTLPLRRLPPAGYRAP